jgi:hypothetical protein
MGPSTSFRSVVLSSPHSLSPTQIRLYVGLLGVTPIWNRTDLASSPAAAQENTSDSDDDYSDSDTRNVYQDEPPRRPFKRFHVRPPYALYGATPVQVDSDVAVQRLLEDEKGRKEERLLSFLNDPEKSVKVFLSSYMRSQGLIWCVRRVILLSISNLLHTH